MTHRRCTLALSAAAIGATAALAAPAPAAGLHLYASLTGTQEAPTKGDPDGTATVTFTISASSRLCYVIRPKKLQALRSAHIHRGAAGVAGSTALTLFTKTKKAKNGKVTGCAKITARQLELFAARPDGFYVDVHTTSYKRGAARGQLATTRR